MLIPLHKQMLSMSIDVQKSYNPILGSPSLLHGVSNPRDFNGLKTV